MQPFTTAATGFYMKMLTMVVSPVELSRYRLEQYSSLLPTAVAVQRHSEP